MPKFDDYTQKTTPEDTDITLILDKTANVNKKTPFSGIWTWIVNKMTNAVIQNLQTTNKTVIGSINELNSKTGFFGVQTINFEVIENNDPNQPRMIMWFYTNKLLNDGYRVDINMIKRKIEISKVTSSGIENIGDIDIHDITST